MGNVRTTLFQVPIEVLERRVLLALFGPDVSFGSGGHADVVGDLVLAPLPGGKILAVGHRSIPGVPGPDSPSDLLMVVSRLNDDGTLDGSFGDGGSVELERSFLGQSSDAEFTGSRLWVIAPPESASRDAPELRAYTPDLALDTSFSDDGRLEMPALIDFEPVVDYATARILAATQDGGVILTQEINDLVSGSGYQRSNNLVKVNADGSLDTTFGTDGFISGLGIGLIWTSHGILARGSDGQALTRYLNDGTVDSTFATGGALTLPSPLRGFREQPDGKHLIVASPVDMFSQTQRLYRYNVDGTLDTTFGTAGSVPLPDASLYFYSDAQITFDDQQRITVVSGGPVRRFSATGVSDPGPFEGDFDLPQGRLAVDDSGRLLVGGHLDVVRYAAHESIELSRDGVLYVTGTDAADDVVTLSAGSTPGAIRISLNGDVTEVDSAGVVGFNLPLGNGDNGVTVSLDLPVTVTTAAGDDTITTGDGDDSISAGTGDNVVASAAGDDAIELGESGAGDDDQHTITGGNGDKRITVRGGSSTITLGVGDSEIDCRRILGEHLITIAGGSNFVSTGSGSVTIGGNGDNRVFAAGFNATTSITTGDGNDRIGVSSGTVRTNGGNDEVNAGGNSGPLTIFLGDGHDRLISNQFAEGAYTVFGGTGNDYLEGHGGAQTFHGEAGKDTLIGGEGVDLLNGGTGNDLLIGGSGSDRLYGWTGDDTLDGGAGNDRLFGHDGADNANGGSGNDVILGGVGDDRLYAESGTDELFGEGGNDRLYADYAAGAATLHGGNGDDLLVSADGLADHLFGDAGTDRTVSDDEDVLDGVESTTAGELPVAVDLPGVVLDTGLLQFDGTDAAQQISIFPDGAGRLVVWLDGATQTFDIGRVTRIELTGNGGDDLLKLSKHLKIPGELDGVGGNDVLIGGAADDRLLGGEGDDYLVGGRGSDLIGGGEGRDTVDYASRTANLFIDLNENDGDGELGENDDVNTDVERIIGGSGDDRITGGTILVGNDGDDTLTGSDGDDGLYGGAGNDHLEGGNGDDYFEGGAGNDTLAGNAGADSLFGLAGNDHLISAGDGIADTVRGGTGTDTGEVDEEDDVLGVENVA